MSLQVYNSRSLKVKITSLFLLLISIAFSLNWMVAIETIRGEKVEDLERVLKHLLNESNDEYIKESLSPTSDLRFLHTISHNQMILDDSEANNLHFLVSKSPCKTQQNEICTSIQLQNSFYLSATSDDVKLNLSVAKYSNKLLIRYVISLVVILLISIVLLHYYMKPLMVLTQKIRAWNNGDSFEFILDKPSKEIKEVSAAFESLIRKIESFRAKEAELFKEAAHELKTPLALMRSRLDVYENTQEYDKNKFVIDLGHDIERLTSELKNVLFLESSDYEDSTNVNVNEIVKKVMHKIDILAHQKELSYTLSEESFVLNTPLKLFEKVLTALIENSMTYAERGSRIDIKIDPVERSIFIKNIKGGEKYLFSSKIGHKLLARMSGELNFTYLIDEDDKHYGIRLNFT